MNNKCHFLRIIMTWNFDLDFSVHIVFCKHLVAREDIAITSIFRLLEFWYHCQKTCTENSINCTGSGFQRCQMWKEVMVYCISEINTPPFLLSERQEETSAPDNFFCLICYCPYIVMNVLRVPIFVKFDRWDSNCHPFMIVLTITATFMGNTTMTCFHHIFNE